jgi:hypothetical protein
MTHNAKLESANVVAAFDTAQDGADDAVQGLRLAGFRDDQVGYLVRDPGGRRIDLLGRAPLAVGAVIGAVVAAGLGLLVAWSVTDGTPPAPHPPTADSPAAVYLTGAVVGLIVGAFAGALCARGAWGAEEVAAGPEVGPGQFVVAVNAGDRRDLAGAVVRHHGGSTPAGHGSAAHTGAGHPA